MSLPVRLQTVADQVPHGATVLDVGCSDGQLLSHLAARKGVDGRGIELDPVRVAAAVARGLSVVQGDADRDLAAFPDGSVDFAILSEALQAMQQPDVVLDNLLRIGRRAIIAFPNFGHWRVRVDLLVRGRMPITPGLPQSWYETRNIHLCTIADFCAFADTRGFRIEAECHRAGSALQRFRPNLLADQALFVLGKG